MGSRRHFGTWGAGRIAAVAALSLVCSTLLGGSPALAASPANVRTQSVPVGWGQVQSTGLTLKTTVGALDTVLNLTDGDPQTKDDHRRLKVGMIIKIESEQMLITGITDNIGDPAGLSESPPYADTVTVLRAQGGTTGAAHSAGLEIKGHYVKIPVDISGAVATDVGTLVGAVGANATQASGATVLDAVLASDTAINVTDATKIVAGSVITIDAEKMAVGAATNSNGDGYAGTTETALGSNPASLVSVPESTLFAGRCADGVDNDRDGTTDGADPGCSATNPDGDGFSSAVESALGSDPNNGSKTPEHSARSGSCTDAIDNDGDGLTDGADAGCDAMDADGDGFIGAVERALKGGAATGSDPGSFASRPEHLLVGGSCADLVDNDGDGLVDARDPGCGLTNPDNDNFGSVLESQLGSNPSSGTSTPEHAAFPSTCSDGVDSDGGGGLDGADDGCNDIDADSDGWSGFIEKALGSNPAATPSTPESPILGTCADGLDNDADGTTDGADPGCSATNPDGDGFSSAVETALGSDPANGSKTPEHSARGGSCTDAIDNDGDGFTDGADTGCDDVDADGDGWSGALERALGSDPANGAQIPESPRSGNTCANGLDDDGDGFIDAKDPTCDTVNSDTDIWANVVEADLGSSTSSAASTPEHAALPSTCSDATDNDTTGGVDADDSGCASLDVDPDMLQVVRAYGGTTAASHAVGASITEDAIDLPVSNGSLLGPGSVLQVGSERMILKRVRTGTPDIAEVLRGVNGTSVASHSSGAPISDIDGTGGLQLTFSIDRAYADVVSVVDGGFLGRCTSDTNLDSVVCGPGDVGREVDCGTDDGGIGQIEESGATLMAGINTSATTLQVSDQSLFRPGMRIRIGSEDMVVKAITEGAPDTLVVYRSATPSAHSVGAPISGQNLALNGIRVVCTSSTSYPFNYGPLGSGTLVYVRLMPMQRTPSSPLPGLDLSGLGVLDTSGDAVPTTSTSGKLTVSKCPDPNGSGKVTQSDWLEISRAVFNIPPIVPDVNKHDLNGNGSIGNEDRLIAARILFLYSIPVPECAVVP